MSRRLKQVAVVFAVLFAVAQLVRPEHAIPLTDVAHDSMLELRWQTVAERILVWLEEQKL